jgi:hypothetical protein
MITFAAPSLGCSKPRLSTVSALLLSGYRPSSCLIGRRDAVLRARVIPAGCANDRNRAKVASLAFDNKRGAGATIAFVDERAA